MRDIARDTFAYRREKALLELRRACVGVLAALGLPHRRKLTRIAREEAALEAQADRDNAEGHCIECRASPSLPAPDHLHRSAP